MEIPKHVDVYVECFINGKIIELNGWFSSKPCWRWESDPPLKWGIQPGHQEPKNGGFLHKTMVNMVMGQAPGTEIFHSRKNDATNTRNRPEGNDNSCKTSTGGERKPSRTGTARKKHAPVTIV
jgi:hypothetical protein